MRKNRTTEGNIKWNKRFIDILCDKVAENGGNLSKSCDELGICISNIYRHIEKETKTGEYLQLKLQIARERGTSALIDEATRRAKDGVEEPVFYQGMEVGNVTRYSDGLLKFLIQGQNKMYSSRYELTGANGAPIKISANINLSRLDQEDILKLIEISEKLNKADNEDED